MVSRWCWLTVVLGVGCNGQVDARRSAEVTVGLGGVASIQSTSAVAGNSASHTSNSWVQVGTALATAGAPIGGNQTQYSSTLGGQSVSGGTLGSGGSSSFNSFQSISGGTLGSTSFQSISGGTIAFGGSYSLRTFLPGTATPGVVDCNGVSCPALSHPQQNINTESYCCVSAQANCYRNTNVAACSSGIPVYCDDASDCDAGLVCCQSEWRILFACATDCGGRTQLCQTDAECRGGMKCSGTTGPSGSWVDGTCQ
jgi:hypothetical protein